MLYQVNQKIPGGKLLRIQMEAEETIQSISITGDFFLHPEDALPQIEKSLVGMSAQSAPHEITKKIEEVLAAESATFVGVASTDIAQLISETLSQKHES